ncbi:MAG: hypothetical protein HOV68_12655 [Streptomycetaceae bacterium]|nr:hypothetical protein [Streptomycetaceae bacterium]
MTGSRVVRGLTGVYNADGGFRGEVAYAIGKVRGTAHCALCDLTHRGLHQRPEWGALVATLPVPFTTVHLNERADEVAAASEGRTPCVIAHTDTGPVVVLGPEELEQVGTSVLRFDQILRDALDAAGLLLPQSE